MDKIILQQMEFYGYHGVFPEENKLGQRFLVDAELYLDLKAAGISDDLTATVNYADVYQTIKDIVQERRFRLIEALAEHIASEVLDTYTVVNALTIRVVKPHPPFAARFAGVVVEIHRKREFS